MIKKTDIEEIRKVNTGGIEINYTEEHLCLSKDFSKPPSTKYYRRSVVIPKEKLMDLQKAIDDKRW
jgi:hypothetical protein